VPGRRAASSAWGRGCTPWSFRSRRRPRIHSDACPPDLGGKRHARGLCSAPCNSAHDSGATVMPRCPRTRTVAADRGRACRPELGGWRDCPPRPRKRCEPSVRCRSAHLSPPTVARGNGCQLPRPLGTTRSPSLRPGARRSPQAPPGSSPGRRRSRRNDSSAAPTEHACAVAPARQSVQLAFRCQLPHGCTAWCEARWHPLITGRHDGSRPFRCAPGRDDGRWQPARDATIALVELSEDPSLASETIDHEHRWPQDPDVQEWLVRAACFLAEEAPERRFMFFSGWIEHHPATTVAMSLDAFLACIRSGTLPSDESYDVSPRPRPRPRHRPDRTTMKWT
jgi:hypothetical protein